MWKSSDFINRKKDIIAHFKKKGVSSDGIAEYCSLAGVPIVVVCEFIIQEFPEHRKLCMQKIKEINDFFGIKEDTCGSCSSRCYQDHCVMEDV